MIRKAHWVMTRSVIQSSSLGIVNGKPLPSLFCRFGSRTQGSQISRWLPRRCQISSRCWIAQATAIRRRWTSSAAWGCSTGSSSSRRASVTTWTAVTRKSYWLGDVDDLLKVNNRQFTPHAVRPDAYGVLPMRLENAEQQIGGGSCDADSFWLFPTMQEVDTAQGT